MTAPMPERAAATLAAEEIAKAEQRAADQTLQDTIVAARAHHRGETERIQQRHILSLHEIDNEFPPEEN